MPSYEQYLDDIFNHGNRTILEVAQVVGKVRIPTADEAFAGIIPIVAQGNFAEEEVTDGIRTKFLDWFHRIDDIALGFTHLVTINDKPAVTINLLRQFIPMERSIAGQMIVWKRTISFPTRCRSTGQKRLNSSSLRRNPIPVK